MHAARRLGLDKAICGSVLRVLHNQRTRLHSDRCPDQCVGERVKESVGEREKERESVGERERERDS